VSRIPYAPSQYWPPFLKMPLYIRDRIVLSPHAKITLLIAIFSAIAYGIVVVLAGNCFHLLQKKRDSYSNRMRIILPIFVIVMLLNSTWNLIGTICRLMWEFNSKPISYFLLRSFTLPIIMTMWGADGFMVMILIISQEQRFTPQL
jgi:hypothetical protein